ncbi:MAG: VOC family protein [Gammaproteobacteria bacterium]
MKQRLYKFGHGAHFSPERRRLLQALPLLAMPGMLGAQTASPVAVRKLHSFGIRVGDVARSVAFYQDLFGAPVQARQGETVCLRIGDGPRYFSIAPVQAGEQPGISHIGLSVADFELGRVQQQLQEFGIDPGPGPVPGGPDLGVAMQSWVQQRPSSGAMVSELYFADVEGIRYHLC